MSLAACTLPEAVPFAFHSVGRSEVGGRQLNEDRILERPDIGLWAVADGMGGHQAGEIASAMVVEALGQIDAVDSAYAYLSGVAAQLRGVNRSLLEMSNGARQVMGSTVVTLIAHEGHYACVWAGDSRAYLYRGGVLARLTHDHSLVQELVDSGALTADQARSHPRAHVITRAVGVAEPLQLERRHGAIEPGDVFLLCSDGLTGAMLDEEIAERLGRGRLDGAADDLLGLALGRSARDNVSFVIVKVDATSAA